MLNNEEQIELMNKLYGVANELDEYIELPIHGEISNKIREIAISLRL